MTPILIIIGIVLLAQVGIFIAVRKKIRNDKKNSVIEKYTIKSKGDAWRLINNPDIPDEDRLKIEALYKGNDNS